MNALPFLRFLLAAVTALAGAGAVHARGGGGCLERGTLVDTPAGAIPVEQLHVGDTVWGTAAGIRIHATVEAVYAVEPENYIELTAAGAALRVTPEHPVQTAPGIFVRADRIAAEHARPDAVRSLWTARGSVALETARVLRATAPAFNLLVSPGGVFFANGFAVHNKGCFLPETPITLADGSRRPISTVRKGDAVLAFEADGRLVRARVRHVLTHDVESYLVLRTESVELRVTEEHPFYVGNGTFKTAEALRTGDIVYVYDGEKLAAQSVLALERITAAATVYNLQTDAPHTFLANGVAVHNKGGGCFVAGTKIRTPAGDRAIESLALGDTVLAGDATGALAPVKVEGVYKNFGVRLTLDTDRGTLRTTAEHPLLNADSGAFQPAKTFGVGSRLAQPDGAVAYVLSIERGVAEEAVYTLSVGAPHTFVADGFIVHNKGGGFHGSRSGIHTGGSGAPSRDDPAQLVVGLLLVAAFIVFAIIKKRNEAQDGELDYCFSRDAIDGKAAKTAELLTFISKVDAAWSTDDLRARAREVFVELQTCWSARDYTPMKPLMLRDLYEQHCAQLQGLRETHELNRLESLRVDAVDIVHVNYTEKKEHRTFTALITATARDTYVDDRTLEFIRGDAEPQQFQEFWTFQLSDGEWKLREIEQTQESDVLTTENLFEQFTDVGRDQIYGDKAGTTGPAGPTLPADVKIKANKIDRLLNFLVQTDKIWNRDEMLATARRVFLNVQLAWQDGRPEMLAGIALDGAMSEHLRAVLASNRERSIRVEHRNLCVRKVEIVHVDNRDDRTLDAFTARISAHAQTIITGPAGELRHDEWVKAWTEFWTFGRDDSRWVLKEVLPEAKAEATLARENVDEGSSQQMLEWYYSKPRAT